MSRIIKNYVSRYVIPFYFDHEDDGYNKIIKKFIENKKFKELGLPKDCSWVKTGFWENYKFDSSIHVEMDIYAYLLEILRDEDEINGCNLGVSYVLKTNGSLLNLQYVNDNFKDRLDFKCNDLGVIFFKNGIGIIWYDIKFAKEISIDDYIDFQYDFKELARTNSDKFRKKIGKEQYDIFCVGEWIERLFNATNLGMKFWAERKTHNGSVGHEVCIPDKSLMFQYMFIDASEEQECMELAFRVANGYDKKYNLPSTLNNETYEPFGNVCFYTSRAGTAYVVSDNESNTKFFKENFKGKYIRDYFFIYVLLLYQTYSSAHYSRLLTKIPADIKELESDKKNLELLERVNDQINLFLVKSTYESVSNIQHQNGTYIYGKKALRIDKDMKSLTVGLEALRGIEVERQKQIDRYAQIQSEKREKQQRESLEQKEKEEQNFLEQKNRALNIAVVIFGFLAVFSVSIDALNLVDWFKEHNMQREHVMSLLFIAVLTVFMFIALITSMRKKK